MNRKEILEKRNKIGNEIERLKEASYSNKDYKTGEALNRAIKFLKEQYTFYNKLLKYIGGNNDN
jgi:hypothetical protein